ncbi:YlzJ-like family protein [Bacillus xiapuensis]|uniref:YlzJ-like family protein n=1 Tax=Bacillus xiapuensis TaxID=2014075 RepID=UPI000C250BDE|nr:YlzJ-like family protein [Bacillus xiapuensis]
MILYTTMPQEHIFPHDFTSEELELISWNGIPLYAERADHQYRVIRIVSTDPSHYLNDSLTPGSMISR